MMRCMVPALGSNIQKKTAEHICGVVGGHAVVCGVINPCQTWPMPHMTLIGEIG